MARIGNKKAFTVHLSDEMAAMIDLKRKEHGAESRRLASRRLSAPCSLRLRSIIAAISSLRWTVNAFLFPIRAIRA